MKYPPIRYSEFAIRHSSFAAATAGLAAVLCLTGGCPPPVAPIRADPLPKHRAAEIVNRNISRIQGTLRATGAVDGIYTLKDGRQRRYHVDATLFHLAPRYFRFDLKKFNERQFLLGSNDQYYWVYSREDDSYFCGRHGVQEDLPPGMPAHPDKILDALGLTLIPCGTGFQPVEGTGHKPVPHYDETPTAVSVQLVQRVVDDSQQLLFLVYDETGALVIEKEYWLDRLPPQLVRSVVFRDGEGVVEMQSELGDYKALSPGGPLLPHVMEATWPRAGASMRFRVGRWTLVTQVGPEGIQFKAPQDCTDR